MDDDKHKDVVQQMNEHFAQIQRLFSQAKQEIGGDARKPKFRIIRGGKNTAKSNKQS